MAKSNLKPCPFCGGDPIAKKHHVRIDEGFTLNWHMVRCQKCNALAFSTKNMAEAIEKWNGRAHEA
jgi:Lar family restriction alleviation protein